MNESKNIDPIWVAAAIIAFVSLLLANIISKPYNVSFLVSGYMAAEFGSYIFIKKNEFYKTYLKDLSLFLTSILIVFFLNYCFLQFLDHEYDRTSLAYKVFINAKKSFSISFLQYYVSYFVLGISLNSVKNALLKFNGSEVKNRFLTQNKSRSLLTNENSLYLGHTKENKPFYLTENNLDHHTQIIGGSGSGKTNLIKNIIEDRIKRNKAVIFLDFKAELDLEIWLKNCLAKHNRSSDFMLFSLSKPQESFFYNPIQTGDVPQIQSKIMESLNWSEVFYQKYSQMSLNIILDYLMALKTKHNRDFSIHDIRNLLSSKKEFYKLESEFAYFLSDKEGQNTLENTLYSEQSKKNLVGLQSDLENICRCSLGANLAVSKNSSLLDMIMQNKFIYFQMNSMLDTQSSRIIGKLLLKDLIFQVGVEFLKTNPSLNCTLIVDEFAEFATDSFSQLINRCRGAKLQIILAHQSSGDLDKISTYFSNQIEANTGNKIIFGTALHEDAEKFSKYLGTKTSQKTTQQTNRNILFGNIESDRGSIRDVEEFVVHPNELKKLKRGQAVVIKRLIDEGHGVVSFPLSSKF